MSKAHYHDPIVPPVSMSGASKRLDALSFALGAADRIVRAPANLALAERAARESIVLLKNEQGLLPLRKEALKRIFYGSLTPIPAVLDEQYRAKEPLPESASVPLADYRMLYAIGDQD